VTTVVRDTALLQRARELLAAGPADSVRLIEYVCQLPGAPRAVAERMAVALFERERGIARSADGRWAIAREAVPCDAVAASRRLDDVSYVVVDVEATGSCAYGGDRVIEVAAVGVHRGEVTDVFETLVNPERGIPPAISSLTRIGGEMLSRAPRFPDVAERIAEALQGRLFVGHNAVFDWRFLSAELTRATGSRLEGERLCTVRLARAVLPQVRRRSLDSLSWYFGIENRARHRAGGDALATAQVLVRLLREARSRGCETVDDVHDLTRRAPSRRRRRRRGLPAWGDGALPA
jgi:DNA polymerase-3 subunit epsilon